MTKPTSVKLPDDAKRSPLKQINRLSFDFDGCLRHFSPSPEHTSLMKTIKRRQWKNKVKQSSHAMKSPRRPSAKSKESKVEKLIMLAKKNKRKNQKMKKELLSRRGRRSSSSSKRKKVSKKR